MKSQNSVIQYKPALPFHQFIPFSGPQYSRLYPLLDTVWYFSQPIFSRFPARYNVCLAAFKLNAEMKVTGDAGQGHLLTPSSVSSQQNQPYWAIKRPGRLRLEGLLIISFVASVLDDKCKETCYLGNFSFHQLPSTSVT